MEKERPPCPKCSTEGCKVWHPVGRECTTDYLAKRCPECVELKPDHKPYCSKRTAQDQKKTE